MLFGTKRLRNIGSDLGGAIAGFKNSLSNKNDETQTLSPHDKE
ncbi:twin-arginine translocase TatA/TatE family subunit [Spongiibacter thalassae]